MPYPDWTREEIDAYRKVSYKRILMSTAEIIAKLNAEHDAEVNSLVKKAKDKVAKEEADKKRAEKKRSAKIAAEKKRRQQKAEIRKTRSRAVSLIPYKRMAIKDELDRIELKKTWLWELYRINTIADTYYVNAQNKLNARMDKLRKELADLKHKERKSRERKLISKKKEIQKPKLKVNDKIWYISLAGDVESGIITRIYSDSLVIRMSFYDLEFDMKKNEIFYTEEDAKCALQRYLASFGR